jgi:hypothetical protein
MKKCSHVVIDLFRVLYYIAIGVGGLVRLADASQTYLVVSLIHIRDD